MKKLKITASEVVITVDQTQAVLEPVKPTLADLCAKCTPENRHEEIGVDSTQASEEVIAMLANLAQRIVALERNSQKDVDIPTDAPLVFIQRKAGNDFEVYQDGKRLRGVRTVVIRADYDAPTTHEIEYVSGRTANE